MSYGNNAIYCNFLSDVPKVDHFAIILGSSYYTEGDERSRTNPGHGYPGGTTNYLSYQAYLKREDWEAAICGYTDSKYGKKDFKAIVVKVPTISTEVKVVIK
jgi:hypothetical protein